jgi:uncharacterized membrane protein YciS (DUF1049 family)
MLKALALLLLLLTLALGMALGAFNVTPTTLDLLLVQWTLPLSVLLALALAVGLLLGLVLGLMFAAMPQRWRRRKAEKALKHTERKHSADANELARGHD